MFPPRIVGLGEVLWDMLPSGPRLGGATANFAVHAAALGAHASLASAVGDDDLGRQAKRLLTAANVDVSAVQTSELPTSQVTVHLDAGGHATYTIEQPVAWDAMQFTEHWRELSRSADAVCFGSLAQRDSRSRSAIRAFIEHSRPDCLKIFDVNLRVPFWEDATLRWGLQHAGIVKVNEHELPLLLATCGATVTDFEPYNAANLLNALPDARAVCVTLGERGSLLASREGLVQHPGFPTKVVDTIGAGDSFTATLAWYTLRGASPEGTLAAANRIGSFVASQSGAMPPLPASLRAEADKLAGV